MDGISKYYPKLLRTLVYLVSEQAAKYINRSTSSLDSILGIVENSCTQSKEGRKAYSFVNSKWSESSDDEYN